MIWILILLLSNDPRNGSQITLYFKNKKACEDSLVQIEKKVGYNTSGLCLEVETKDIIL